MSIEITTPHDRTIEVSAHRVLYITNTRTGQLINAALSLDEAKKVADALDPDRDFPGVDWKIMYEHGIRNRIAAVARLAAERDEANARAEQAENARDTAATRAEQLEKRLPKVMSDYQDLEDEARPAVTRADIEKTVRRYIPSTHFSELIADEVCALFGIEDEQPADPVEKLAEELWPILRPDEAPWRESVSMSAEGTMHGAVLRKMMGTVRAAAAHVLGQEADHA